VGRRLELPSGLIGTHGLQPKKKRFCGRPKGTRRRREGVRGCRCIPYLHSVQAYLVLFVVFERVCGLLESFCGQRFVLFVVKNCMKESWKLPRNRKSCGVGPLPLLAWLGGAAAIRAAGRKNVLFFRAGSSSKGENGREKDSLRKSDFVWSARPRVGRSPPRRARRSIEPPMDVRGTDRCGRLDKRDTPKIMVTSWMRVADRCNDGRRSSGNQSLGDEQFKRHRANNIQERRQNSKPRQQFSGTAGLFKHETEKHTGWRELRGSRAP